MVTADFDPGGLVAEIAAKGSGSPISGSLEYGFTRIGPAKAARLVAYTPPPLLEIKGFELRDVLYAPESILGPSGEQVLVYVYRGPGMEHITVTSRLMAVEDTVEGGVVAATPEDWIDPLHRGMTDESETAFVVATTPAGHALTIDTLSPLHAWGIVGGAVVTIEGNVLPDVLAPAVDQVLAGG